MTEERVRRRTWGYWTRAKLQILADYLDSFSTAAKRAPHRVYLDGFAGEGRGLDRITGEEFAGSARIALEVAEPPFTHLRYFELAEHAARLEAELRREYPGRDIRVYPGDCNETIPKALGDLHSVRRAPAFAFLDPDGMQLRWESVEALAAHRPGGRKVELWMLFPVGALGRILDLQREATPHAADRATRLFGTEEWRPIFEARRSGTISGFEARKSYVNLMRWKLERVAGYKWTHPLEIKNLKGAVLYEMIFATDSSAGTQIMSHLYTKAFKEIPEMRQAILDEQRGAARLFPLEDLNEPADPYRYVEPWPPETYP